MSTQAEQPAPAGGYLSPDGYWWWDGSKWIPAPQPPQPPPPPPQLAYAPPRLRRPVPWLRILAGSSAVLGAIATLVASIVPYGSFPDPNGGPTTTSSIFSGGFSGAGWDIPEPVFAVLAGVVAATLVFIGVGRVAEAVSAGALLAIGVQTATMWGAYLGLAGTDGSPGAGAAIGIVGAALLFVAGLLALAAVLRVRPATDAAAPAPAAAAAPVVAPSPALEPAPAPEPTPPAAAAEAPTP